MKRSVSQNDLEMRPSQGGGRAWRLRAGSIAVATASSLGASTIFANAQTHIIVPKTLKVKTEIKCACPSPAVLNARGLK